jgi:hypothetical protein
MKAWKSQVVVLTTRLSDALTISFTYLLIAGRKSYRKKRKKRDSWFCKAASHVNSYSHHGALSTRTQGFTAHSGSRLKGARPWVLTKMCKRMGQGRLRCISGSCLCCLALPLKLKKMKNCLHLQQKKNMNDSLLFARLSGRNGRG